MRLESLGAGLLDGVQLHEALHQLRPLRRTGRNADQHSPLAGGINTIVDDLGAVQIGRAVKHLGRRAVARHVPVVHRRSCHQAELGGGDPLPEHHLLRHRLRLELLLLLEIKDLERVIGGARGLCLEGNDLLIGVHDSRISRDLAARRLQRRCHVDNDQAVLRRRFTYADVLFGLHGNIGEGDELLVDAHVGQHQQLLHLNRRGSGHRAQICRPRQWGAGR
mmetsp:Transcript_8388/g.21650  ORF Transcript_8388/g.21650 Transcript_8388/m.21650 type:complete len:221 (+) Transcript_8388:4626-5288(+)